MATAHDYLRRSRELEVKARRTSSPAIASSYAELSRKYERLATHVKEMSDQDLEAMITRMVRPSRLRE
jgi:hypothetical protein